jgi:hypothetical protein
VLTAVLLGLLAARPAQADGLIINPTYDTASFISAGYNVAQVEAAYNYVIGEYESLYKNNITINIEVEAGPTTLGESESSLAGYYTYSQVRNALAANVAAAPSADGTAAINSLPLTDPTHTNQYALTTANAKALGLMGPSSSLDGIFIFSNAQSYTFDPNNRQVPGEFDFIGVAEHETSEIMGRIPLLGANLGNGPTYDLNDLYRYTASGRSLSASDSNVYFSLNNGTTNLTYFNGNNGGDVDDYTLGTGLGGNPNDPYDWATGPDQGHALTSVDMANMIAIGYEPMATPEPSSLTLLGTGLVAVVAFRFRRRKTAL